MLFVVGGNGGNAGAEAINDMCKQHEVGRCTGFAGLVDRDQIEDFNVATEKSAIQKYAGMWE